MKKKVMLGIALGTLMTTPVVASPTADAAITKAIQSGSYVVDFSSLCSSPGRLSKEQKAVVQETVTKIYQELNNRLSAIENLKSSTNGNARASSERRLSYSLQEHETLLTRAWQINKALIRQHCPGVSFPL